MKDKIDLIFKPFLIALFGLTIGYTFLNWLIFIKLELFQLKEIYLDFGIPAVLSAITAWFILRSRLNILSLKNKKGTYKDFYCFILWIILSAPLIIAQGYIITATGKLTKLNSISEINTVKPTKYYTLKNYYISKNRIGIQSAFDVSGKQNESFNMHIFAALPIFEKASDTNGTTPFAWLGIEYRKTISNRLESTQKNEAYQTFATESQNEFNHQDVSNFVYLSRLRYSDKREGFIDAIKNNKFYSINQTVLESVNEPFEARNGNKLAWIIGSAIIGAIVWLSMISIPKINQAQLNRIKSGKPERKAQRETKEFLDFLKPKEGYFITLLLVYANIGIYLLMVIMGLGFMSFKGQDLLRWGANYGPLTKDGEWWRLLTNTFLHGGLMHVLNNIYGLLFVGIFLEPLLGRIRYLAIYVLTGILASLSSIWWHEATVSVGASGAIFGLYGVFLALLLMKVYPADFAKSFLISTSLFIGFNLLMGLTGGIDNAAHIGGLLSGFIIGFILYKSLKKKVKIQPDEENKIISQSHEL